MPVSSKDSDITAIKGIGEKSAALFHKVGVFSLYDLIRYYPSSYIRYPGVIPAAELEPDTKAAVKMQVLSEAKVMRFNGRVRLTFDAGDETGKARIVFFNAPYLKKSIKPGMEKVFYGPVRANGSSYEMLQPKMYDEKEYSGMTKGLKPVYPLTKGLTGAAVTKAVSRAFEALPAIQDHMSGKDREHLGLGELRESLYQMHFPEDEERYKEARKRIVFDEFYFFLSSVKRMKDEEGMTGNDFPMVEVSEARRLMESLPYRLTGSQMSAYADVTEDLGSGHAMNRLIEGDVGSGKTVVAVLAMLTAVKNGHQAALMAPTEVLAQQHMRKISAMLEQYDVNCVLLTGAMSEKQKREVRQSIADGSADIIIGTHALITELVEYKDLALVVTDEQHRFGVRQRKSLSDKAGDRSPHILVMSATPIPRTLAIILYGDLDISVMKDKPSQRLPVKNAVVDTDYRKKAYNFIRKEVKAGHQAYVICPLIEPGEDDSGENTLEYAQKLREIWGSEVRVGVLHGRMKNAEKNNVMTLFASGDTDVLVSTTVVEVGVDVPNATVMMIENADHYGLSQLHQLRGRIGRGDAQSYCIFVDTSKGREMSERLSILKKTNDGFEIASEDLKLRGPGDIFGLRQSGELGFRVADIYTDAAILAMASEYAKEHAYDTEDGSADSVVL
ncbi:MAG: ATP-dependent DNA helicase RecG [Lachnospiraceae bacterium]|nr:ATP-dependent DNA helicase RecG [Lachnospiraceae bacterium]